MPDVFAGELRVDREEVEGATVPKHLRLGGRTEELPELFH
jgi:hypothetical protein